jgi:hypothetical protein
MIAVLSNLDIQILAAWKDGRAVPLRRYQGNASEGARYFREILNGMDGR